MQYFPRYPKSKLYAVRPHRAKPVPEKRKSCTDRRSQRPGAWVSIADSRSPAMIAEYESDWSDELNGDGYRPADSQPTVPNSGNGELSFPSLPKPAISPVRASTIDGERTRRRNSSARWSQTTGRGSKRTRGTGRTNRFVTNAIRDYGESESGGETQGVASERMRGIGLGRSACIGWKSVSSPTRVRPTVCRDWPRSNSLEERPLRGDTTVGFDVTDSLADGRRGHRWHRGRRRDLGG